MLLSRSGASEIAEETGQTGIAGSFLDQNDLDRTVARAVEDKGRLDAAVFLGGRQADILRDFDISPPPQVTAGSFAYDANYPRDLFDIPFEAWQANYDMNVLGPMRLFKAALPAFRAAGGGSFVAISGIEALQPRLPYPLGPDRLALHGFIKLLSDRHGREGIRLNCIAPGLVENAADEFPEGWVDHVPMGRHARLSEIAGSVAFLLSKDAGYVTGQSLVADGGVNRSPGL